MKVFKSIIIFALALCLLSFAACAPKDDNADDSNDKGNEEQTRPVEFPDYLNFGEGIEPVEYTETPEYPKGYPTEQDVIDAYKVAEQAMSWFNVTAVPALDDKDVFVSDAVYYARVKSETVTDMESLRAYLETIFDYDRADLLMEESQRIGRFVEMNGKLYCTAFCFDVVGYSDEEEFEVKKISDDEYKITVAYKTLLNDGTVDGEYTRDNTFVKVDGRWIFQDFLLYRL